MVPSELATLFALNHVDPQKLLLVINLPPKLPDFGKPIYEFISLGRGGLK